jgi:hypothetical protein
MRQTLTFDQRCALSRLQRFLHRRSELEQSGQVNDDVQRARLVHVLDHAIARYYRLACELGLEREANTLLCCYRMAHAAGYVCGPPSLAV